MPHRISVDAAKAAWDAKNVQYTITQLPGNARSPLTSSLPPPSPTACVQLPDGHYSCECLPDCDVNNQSGEDGCGGKCGFCTSGEVCFEQWCFEDISGIWDCDDGRAYTTCLYSSRTQCYPKGYVSFCTYSDRHSSGGRGRRGASARLAHHPPGLLEVSRRGDDRLGVRAGRIQACANRQGGVLGHQPVDDGEVRGG